jgi:ornithine cyclodeaminase/alanine dehydrogenase-like protein (mu-crystallin family)
LADAADGRPLAVIDSIELTVQRTAAATAVAAKHLARRNARTATIIGCGRQGAAQLLALTRVLPLERVTALDADGNRARDYAAAMSTQLGIDVRAGKRIEPADVIVTCTPSSKPFLGPEHLAPGTFVAAVGADNPEKNEITAEAMRKAIVVADVLEQAATIGDLRAAIAACALTRDDVRGELGAMVAGRLAGRCSDDEIIVFDSTGAGFQDAAAASIAYERALASGRGTRISFRGPS